MREFAKRRSACRRDHAWRAFARRSARRQTPTSARHQSRGAPITPLGGYVIGSIACAAVSPMIATVILGRELTISEAYHTTLGCMLGPVGWLG